jgi:hypothetical protein
MKTILQECWDAHVRGLVEKERGLSDRGLEFGTVVAR